MADSEVNHMKNKKIDVHGKTITVLSGEKEDYISLTDIARHKDELHTDDIVKNWLRNRNTIELLGFWEQLHNPDFKPVEFDGFRKQAGLIHQNLAQSDRLTQLNKIAITQMKSLVQNSNIKKLR